MEAPRRGDHVDAGSATPQAVMGGWPDSDGHRVNVMRGDVNQLGAGEDGRFRTLLFAHPR